MLRLPCKSAAASIATKGPQARHQTQPSPAKQGGCHQVPRLPRERKVDVTKCHACHAKVPRRQSRPGAPSASPDPAQSRKTKVDVTKFHGCHMKRRWMSATPATQKCSGVNRDQRPQARHQSQPSPRSATPATRNDGECRQKPCLPCEMMADATKCHGCHAKVTKSAKVVCVCDKVVCVTKLYVTKICV